MLAAAPITALVVTQLASIVAVGIQSPQQLLGTEPTITLKATEADQTLLGLVRGNT